MTLDMSLLPIYQHAFPTIMAKAQSAREIDLVCEMISHGAITLALPIDRTEEDQKVACPHGLPDKVPPEEQAKLTEATADMHWERII